MRRVLPLFLAMGLCTVVATGGLAQTRSTDKSRDEDRAAARNRERLDKEMLNRDLPLPEFTNAGPCPFVKVLYDAARTIEFVGDRQSSGAVAYSGEIQGLTANCKYQGAEPIAVDMNITFAVGKGPQATSGVKEYGYWIAVTDRDRQRVLAKEQFSFSADLSATDRTLVFERISGIVIPRAASGVSGENFEVLVGFNVTPEMAAFNRLGTRFVVNATGAPPPGSAQGQ